MGSNTNPYLADSKSDQPESANRAVDTAGGAERAHPAKQVSAHVQVHLESDAKTISPGQEFMLAAVFVMEPGWHIYYKESGDAGMPTGIVWKLPEGFEAGELLWEKPQRFDDGGIITFGYENKTVIASKIKIAEDIDIDEKCELIADIKWLSCKELCLPGEARVSLVLPIQSTSSGRIAGKFKNVGFKGKLDEIEAAHSQSESEASIEDKAPADEPSENANTSDISILDRQFGDVGAEKEQMSLPAYLLFAFIGGLILNFMPCVLPVISIKILSFMEQADEEPKRVRMLGLIFASGILFAFMVLAALVLAVRQAGQSVGWGFQFQYPGFVIFMCVVILLLALSLFGMFYLSFNAGQEQLDRLANKEGAVGTFFKGILATTLSTPCTAPFLGAALGFAFTQPAPMVLAIFFSCGLGMAFPYVLLTMNSSWMRYLPKPGDWMEKFKEGMGFLLLGTVIWLLSVLGSQIGNEGVMWVSFFLLFVSLSAWIISRYTNLSSTGNQVAIAWIAAILVSMAGFYLFILEQPAVMNGLYNNGDKAEPDLQDQAHKAGSDDLISWTPFSIAVLDRSIKEGKTIFLDFTADWCLTCKVNERTVLNTPPVVRKLNSLAVMPMKADWTRQDPTITNLLTKFNRSGVPLYVIFPASSPDKPIVLPEVITQNIILEALDKAGPSKEKNEPEIK